MENLNSVAITGFLTRDPELRHTGSGVAVGELRVGVNSRRKDSQTDEWVDKPNFVNVTVWGVRGANCAEYLKKGDPVAVSGRLDWQEWEAKDGSGKREAVKIIASNVQFLRSKKDSEGAEAQSAEAEPEETVDAGEPVLASVGAGEDDIPF